MTTACVICNCNETLARHVNLDKIQTLAGRANKHLISRDRLCSPEACYRFLNEIKTSDYQQVILLACNEFQATLKRKNFKPEIPFYIFNIRDYIQYGNGNQNLTTQLILNSLPGFMQWATHARAEQLCSRKIDHSVSIIGDSRAADVCTTAMLKMNYEIVRILPSLNLIKKLSKIESDQKYQDIISVTGETGNFTFAIRLPDSSIQTIRASALAFAEDCVTVQNSPVFTEREKCAITLQELNSLIKTEEGTSWIKRRCDHEKNIVFAFGISRPGNSAHHTGSALATALQLAKSNIPVVFLFKQMHVADYGAEELYRQARIAGVKFIRYKQKPEFKIKGNELLTSCEDDDATLNHPLKWQIQTALLITEDFIRLPATTERLSRLLKIPLGPDGLVMSDNINYHTTSSNVRGIFVFGNSRKDISSAEQEEHGDSAAAEINNLLGPGLIDYYPDRVNYRPESCSLCLSCLRNCPHGAISLDGNKLFFSAISCTACGICSTMCPAGAITRLNYDRLSFQHLISDNGKLIGKSCNDEPPKPKILVFMCENSAAEALTCFSGPERLLPDNLHLVSLPCAAYVSQVSILDAFIAGFSGVLILACHRENCQHLNGNLHAESRVKQIKKTLISLKYNPDRVKIDFVATHMGSRAYEAIADFAQSIENIEAINKGQ